MVFETKFFFLQFLVVFASLLALTGAADLNELKKNALKKIGNDIESIKQIASKTTAYLDEAEGNIKYIGKHQGQYGQGIVDSTYFQMNANAKSSYILANLLGSPDDVFRCLDYRHREGKDETGKFYTENFLKPGQKYEGDAEQVQRDTIKVWKDDYYKAINQYNSMYERSASEIQKATYESQIYSVVNQFERTTKEMANIVISIRPKLEKIHIQILFILDNLVVNLQKFSVLRIEKTAENMRKCFPKKSIFDYKPHFLDFALRA